MLKQLPRPRVRGLSVVELMVAIAIGMFVVLGGIQVYLTAARGGADTIRSNRLNQDLRAIMNVMVDDIRRAGHVSNPTGITANPFTQAGTNLVVSANCVRYSYDATWKGGTPNVVDAGTDFGGFRLSGNTVQFLLSNNNADTSTCIDGLGWQAVTDPAAVRITALNFSIEGSKCVMFRPEDYNENDPTKYIPWEADGSTATACMPGSGASAPSPFPTGHTLVEVRTVRITLTGQHAADSTLVSTLTDTVTLRTPRIFTN